MLQHVHVSWLVNGRNREGDLGTRGGKMNMDRFGRRCKFGDTLRKEKEPINDSPSPRLSMLSRVLDVDNSFHFFFVFIREE